MQGGSEAREQNKVWLMQQVNHVLEPLMLALVREKPENHVSNTCISLIEVGLGQIHGRIFGEGVW